MTMQGWAGDCIALLNHLGIASAHVAGHSFGAGIALQMAIDAPDRVRKLALLEPPPSPPVSSSSSPRMIWICQMSNKPRFDLDSSGCDDRRVGVDFTFSREWRISGYDFSVRGETQGNATQLRRRIFR